MYFCCRALDVYIYLRAHTHYNVVYYFLILSICPIWIFISYLSRYFAHTDFPLVTSINNVSLKIISTCNISLFNNLRYGFQAILRHCHPIGLPNNTKPLIPLNCPFIKLGETPTKIRVYHAELEESEEPLVRIFSRGPCVHISDNWYRVICDCLYHDKDRGEGGSGRYARYCDRSRLRLDWYGWRANAPLLSSPFVVGRRR